MPPHTFPPPPLQTHHTFLATPLGCSDSSAMPAATTTLDSFDLRAAERGAPNCAPADIPGVNMATRTASAEPITLVCGAIAHVWEARSGARNSLGNTDSLETPAELARGKTAKGRRPNLELACEYKSVCALNL